MAKSENPRVHSEAKKEERAMSERGRGASLAGEKSRADGDAKKKKRRRRAKKNRSGESALLVGEELRVDGEARNRFTEAHKMEKTARGGGALMVDEEWRANSQTQKEGKMEKTVRGGSTSIVSEDSEVGSEAKKKMEMTVRGGSTSRVDSEAKNHLIETHNEETHNEEKWEITETGGRGSTSLVGEEPRVHGDANSLLILCCRTPKTKTGSSLFWHLMDPHEVVEEEKEKEKLNKRICSVEQPWFRGPGADVMDLYGCSIATVGKKIFVVGGKTIHKEGEEDPVKFTNFADYTKTWLSNSVYSCALTKGSPPCPGSNSKSTSTHSVLWNNLFVAFLWEKFLLWREEPSPYPRINDRVSASSWKEESQMKQPRYRPVLVPFNGNLYAFGSNSSLPTIRPPFGEVFNLEQGKWSGLTDPPLDITWSNFITVGFASINHYTDPPCIILHLSSPRLFLRFTIGTGTWSLLADIPRRRGLVAFSHKKTVVMRNILYTVPDTGGVIAYDLRKESWLDKSVIELVELVPRSHGSFLVHIGQETLCLVSFMYPTLFDYQVEVFCIKFQVKRVYEEGGKMSLLAENMSTTRTRTFYGAPLNCMVLENTDLKKPKGARRRRRQKTNKNTEIGDGS